MALVRTIAVVLAVAGCSIAPDLPRDATPAPAPPTVNEPVERVRYVALGDSYTIGTSVAEFERFPNQLAETLPQLELVANLGVNGFTSRDLIEVELPKLPALRPDVVTLLIGVNDVVQGVSVSEYKDNLVLILPRLIELVGKDRIIVVTIPDYTVTPQGAAFGDPDQQSSEIREFNLLMTQLATGFGIDVVDIYAISLDAATDPTLVAGDGLHPSGTQYALWVEHIAVAMETLLGR